MTRSCIYCRKPDEGEAVSHIVPESLGGPTSPVAPHGVVCSGCNQYFGQKVESEALSSFPFSEYRLFFSVPTKKGKMVSMPSHLGTLHGSGRPRIFGLDPADERIAAAVNKGEVTQLRVLSEVTKPLAVCRMLLKIGLDMLGKHFYDVAISDRVEAARRYARSPARGQRWWFMLRSDPTELLGGFEPSESAVEIVETDGVLVSVLQLPSVAAIVPLEDNTLPPSPLEFPEPLYRIVWATC
jgi:HNH endonuclease